MSKAKCIIRHFLRGIVLLVLNMFLLNLFLTYRLEQYLKKELALRVSVSTAGFYSLSFENLSIRFLKGELLLEGIRLYPDSTQFLTWQKKDSLPSVYLKADIDKIDLKGVNLTWRTNYKRLHFESFEIQTPVIRVVSPTVSSMKQPLKEERRRVDLKTLYDIISPYVDELTVQTLDLKNASISYSIENPAFPITYALTGVDFQAYGFLLDKNSSESGKLLYCDNFHFVTNRAQTLLTNNTFQLQTGQILLNTKDSVISISNIQIIPQRETWEKQSLAPDRFLSAQVQSVKVTGINFQRERGENNLKARSFLISDSDIHAFYLTEEKRAMKHSLSLYKLLSPVLNSVSIDTIGVEKARMAYSFVVKDLIERYKLENLNFYAYHFLVDSISEVQQNFWYSRNFRVEAEDIEGIITSQNQQFTVKRMALNTEEGELKVEGVDWKPLSVRRKETVLSGSLDSFRVRGLRYKQGILYTKRLHIGNARIEMTRQLAEDSLVYRLNDCSFYVTNLSAGWKSGVGGFSNVRYDRIGFRFGQFDNLLWGGNYRLSIQKGEYWDPKKGIQLQNVRLVPQEKLKNRHKTVIQFSSPSIKIGGFEPLVGGLFQKNWVLDSVYLESPVTEFYYGKGDPLQLFSLDSVGLYVKNLQGDDSSRSYRWSDIGGSLCNVSFPLDKGFYTLSVGRVEFSESMAQIKRIRLLSRYPKMEFAYKQPKHQDWFDLQVGEVSLVGVDYLSYLRDSILRIKEVQIEDIVLQNFKNQQIPVPRRVVPMIYSGLQKAPMKIDFQKVGVKNLMIVYEELAKNGTVPGKLYFTDMKGTFSEFTNIVSRPEQFITLNTTGKLMGEGTFRATWLLPVDSLNDRFSLNIQLDSFNLKAMNELLIPLASAEVQSGLVQSMKMSTDASSKEARVDMLFLYTDLKVSFLKEKKGELQDKKLLSTLANRVLKQDNPERTKKGEKQARRSSLSVVRDPYHSTFNYLWQIIKPPLVETIGVSQKTQEIVPKTKSLMEKIKNIFRGKKNKNKEISLSIEEAQE